MTIKNAKLNGQDVALIDANYNLGTSTQRTTSGATKFMERPAVFVLQGTGQAFEDFLSACADGDEAINAISFSYDVEKGGQTVMQVDVTEASAVQVTYDRAVQSVGQSSLKLMVRAMSLTLGSDTLTYEFEAEDA